MNLSRCTIAVLLSMLMTACTQKPSFETPSVIIEHALVSQDAEKSEPPSLLINVPFSSQAPFAVWDALHEEACEEMALIMVHHFLNETPLSPNQAESEVQALIAWERANGFSDDVSIAQLGTIASAFYGLHVRVLTDVTADTLKVELAGGNPVIVPAAGRMLGNPFFSGAGPWYHMLVVTGYDKNGFITNDAGTKRGGQYWYSEDILMNALHDWTGIKEDIEKGPKMALVIEK